MTSSSASSTRRYIAYVLLAVVVLTCGVLSLFLQSSPLKLHSDGDSGDLTIVDSLSMVPQQLLNMDVYQNSDFANEIGKRPSFWEPNNTHSWGPCYPERRTVRWRNSSHLQYRRDNPDKSSFETVHGGCRPGFLIIGAGKCGTSSLYHYLVGHPRVAPAIAKQIHYFKYHTDKSLGWYYSWFPTTKSFLQSGALMTGEASPGYLPYPQVVHQVHKTMPGPKVITVGRNPIKRIYSSYRYNYVQPTVESLKKGGRAGIRAYQPDEYYEPFLFSLEDLVKAELKRLRECFAGFGIKDTRSEWYAKKWTQAEFDRRDQQGLDPLIDLDAFCYGRRVSNTVLRPQWAEIQTANPKKVLLKKNAFLVQSLIGRSLYVFPLEWWYILFQPEDMLFVCTEELSNATVVNDLALQLGLPSYNFTDAISDGAYNAGGHKGYDKATSWDQVQEEHSDGVPLTQELRKELLEFMEPYNERLFALTGKRCNWA